MSGIEQLTENIIQSERTQFKRLYTVGFHLCEKSRMDKSKETEVRLVSCHLEPGGKCDGKEVTSKRYGESW